MYKVVVIQYKGKYYIHYKNNAHGFAQLIDDQGKKFSGTPSKYRLNPVKVIPCKKYNGTWYFNTKIGVFSASTGKQIIHPKIIEMFK